MSTSKSSGSPVLVILAPVAVAVGAWLLVKRILKKGGKDEGGTEDRHIFVDADLASPHTGLVSPHTEGEFHDAHPELDDEPSPRGPRSQPEIVPADAPPEDAQNGTDDGEETDAESKARIAALLKRAAETDEKLSRLVESSAPK